MAAVSRLVDKGTLFHYGFSRTSARCSVHAVAFSRVKGSHVICKCHLCNAYLYPGDKRYRLKVWIFPDTQEDLSTAPQPCFKEIGEAFLPDGEENPWFEPLEEEEPESCQEASLVLCKSCQDRLLRNPLFREHLLFPAQEWHAKRIH